MAGIRQRYRKEAGTVKHNLHASVSKAPQTECLVIRRNGTVRERLPRFFFGKKRRVTILIPGDSLRAPVDGKDAGETQEGSFTNRASKKPLASGSSSQVFTEGRT